ncbi:MAG TPA: histidine--tRNA ligase [Verrucomicrobiae bacterium]|nr:histidine--tRNA ligase [Verrucomicrobiae bacterium]
MNPLPGFRDFYPEALAVRRYVFDKWHDAARRYGFREYDGPPLEPLELYTQKSGAEIVGQLFNFVDKGDRAVALRPEMTPTLARMVGAHHRDYKKPIKWFAIPQLFRYEKQQRGRLREHFQFNADIIGETDVSADAELIGLAIDTLRSFGLTEKDFVVRVSDRRMWQRLLAAAGIAEDKQYAAFQAIDKLEREPAEKTREKLVATGLSVQQVEEVLAIAEGKATADAPELQQVLGKLGELAPFCKVDFKIVRGLAYYTGIVWEIHDCKGELRAVAGGGRYDNLLKQVSGVDLPALGFGMGDVVLGELLKDRGLLPASYDDLDCYVVIADEALRNGALKLIHQLRDAGIAVDYALTPTKVGKQFQVAVAAGARFAVTIGPDEWNVGEVKLKDLSAGMEERVPQVSLAARLKKTF